MKLLRNVAIATGLLAMVGSVQAGVIFSDGFEDSSITGQTGSTLNWDGGANWSVSDGSVDLIKSPDYGLSCHTGDFCVDLDGSTGNAGLLTSLNLGPLAAGLYKLTYWVSGNQRGGGDFTVSAILNDWQQIATESFSLAADAPWEEHTLNFTLTNETNPLTISFNNYGYDNVGMMLDDVSLVPAPATLALFGLGLLGLGAAGRKASKA